MNEEETKESQHDSLVWDFFGSCLGETIGCLIAPFVLALIIVGGGWIGGIPWLGYLFVALLVCLMIAIVVYIVRKAVSKQ